MATYSHSLSRLEMIARQDRLTLEQLYRRMMQRPASLGFTWERGALTRPIMFYDMLGKNIEIPFDFCHTKEVASRDTCFISN